MVRGYICGSNDGQWQNHVFSHNCTGVKNIQTYLYRFEFQKRGTVHIHFFVWLKQPQYMQLTWLHADLPIDNSILLYHVRKCQHAHKSSLPIHNAATIIRGLHNGQEIFLSRVCAGT